MDISAHAFANPGIFLNGAFSIRGRLHVLFILCFVRRAQKRREITRGAGYVQSAASVSVLNFSRPTGEHIVISRVTRTKNGSSKRDGTKNKIPEARVLSIQVASAEPRRKETLRLLYNIIIRFCAGEIL